MPVYGGAGLNRICKLVIYTFVQIAWHTGSSSILMSSGYQAPESA